MLKTAARVAAAALIATALHAPSHAQNQRPGMSAAPQRSAPAAAPRAVAPRMSPAPRSFAPRAVSPQAPRMAQPRQFQQRQFQPRQAQPRQFQPRQAQPRQSFQRSRQQAQPRVQQRQFRAQQGQQGQQRQFRAQQQRQERIDRRAQQNRERRQDVTQTDRLQRRQLQARENRELRELQAQQRRERAKSGRLDRAQLRDLRARERQQVQDLRARQREERNRAAQGLRDRDLRDRDAQRAERVRRREGVARMSPQVAAQGRFAARYQPRGGYDARLARLAARHAWRRGHRAHFVAWLGPVFWPYAYYDIFYYPFWPYAYDEGYWAYAYDDIFESVYWPAGSAYADNSYVGPYPEGMASAVPGGRATARSRAASRAVEQVCEPDKGLTAWPFDRIESAVQANAEQRALLDGLKAAAKDAAEAFKRACPTTIAMTPPGRLDVMIARLAATLESVRIVRPPLEAFYNALSDEQKARFNAIGPDLGATAAQGPRGARADNRDPRCGEAKPGLATLPMEDIDDAVEPTDAQRAAFDRLREANEKAVAILQAACPDTMPQTPVGRLDAMQKRLEAMLEAAKTVQPALGEFFAGLSNEQKARFNTLGRQASSAGQ